MIGGKKGWIFSARGIAKNVRVWSSREKEEQERIYCKIEMPIIFINGSYVETPLYTMCWINEDGDKGQVWEQGEELGGGGGADTRREGLKEHSV